LSVVRTISLIFITYATCSVECQVLASPRVCVCVFVCVCDQWSNYRGPRGPSPLNDLVTPQNIWFERVQGGL